MKDNNTLSSVLAVIGIVVLAGMLLSSGCEKKHSSTESQPTTAEPVTEKVSQEEPVAVQAEQLIEQAQETLVELKKETGFDAFFGPVYAKDIPEYLEQDGKKFPEMCRAKHPILFRLEMLFAMNGLIWAVTAGLILIFKPSLFLSFSLLFWATGLILYAGYPWIPGNRGWLKSIGLSFLTILGFVIGNLLSGSREWYARWDWMVTVLLVSLWLGLDIRGILSGKTSEAAEMLEKLGIHSVGKLYSSRGKTRGGIVQDKVLCTGCRKCILVCPNGVFDYIEEDKKADPARPEECFTCGACVFQCPEKALKFHMEIDPNSTCL